MDAQITAWIIAIVTGSTIAKFAALFLKERDPGVVAGPVLGVIGAVGAWQGAVLAKLIAPEDLVFAGIVSATGALLVYLSVAFLKK